VDSATSKQSCLLPPQVGMFVTGLNLGHNVDEGTYALLGAASFLGGSMRMTVSSCVMLLELTNNLALLPLVMLVLLVAKVSVLNYGWYWPHTPPFQPLAGHISYTIQACISSIMIRVATNHISGHVLDVYLRILNAVYVI
jgi:hypothetical protein